jgi:hypothetical protein
MNRVIVHTRLQALRHAHRHPDDAEMAAETIDLLADALVTLEKRVTDIEKRVETSIANSHTHNALADRFRQMFPEAIENNGTINLGRFILGFHNWLEKNANSIRASEAKRRAPPRGKRQRSAKPRRSRTASSRS